MLKIKSQDEPRLVGLVACANQPTQHWSRTYGNWRDSNLTPHGYVSAQVSIVSDILKNRFQFSLDFAEPNVKILDPAVGTGTYLLKVIDEAMDCVRAQEGGGARVIDVVGRDRERTMAERSSRGLAQYRDYPEGK